MLIVQHLRGMNGTLSKSNLNILMSLIDTPSQALWQSAKNIIISDQPLITLNAAVRAVTQGRVEIGELPDTFTFYRAFDYAVKKRRQCFHQMEVCDTES
jgi:hypothetical protein